MSLTLGEDMFPDVGPKFLESVGRHAPGKAFRRTQERASRIGFAPNAPSVGEEVTPDNRHVTSVSGLDSSAVNPGSKGKLYVALTQTASALLCMKAPMSDTTSAIGRLRKIGLRSGRPRLEISDSLAICCLAASEIRTMNCV
jgi:hypothetical protein